jgi:hypothetical protein
VLPVPIKPIKPSAMNKTAKKSVTFAMRAQPQEMTFKDKSTGVDEPWRV